MRVLHVSEAMGGGVTSAILAMVEATPGVDHHLLMRPRAAHDTGADLAAYFNSVSAVGDNPLVALRALHRLNRDLFPDVVHAHSSFGGVLARVAALDRTAIVYSPHCFAFERRDIGRAQRTLFETVERSLVPRTDLVVAVAPTEIELAAHLGHTQIAYVPNRATLDIHATASFRAPATIVAVGRICKQKDWRYFLHLKRYCDEHLPINASWHWLGGGDAVGERALREAGIAVSGWIPRDELVERMAAAQIYVHTAAWEAAPISILEAASLGLPLVLRSIPPLASLSLPGRQNTVVGLARRIASLTQPDFWLEAQIDSFRVSDEHSIAQQGDKLRTAYERVTGAASDVGLELHNGEHNVAGVTVVGAVVGER